jgi:hypothetical protein
VLLEYFFFKGGGHMQLLVVAIITTHCHFSLLINKPCFFIYNNSNDIKEWIDTDDLLESIKKIL